MRLPGAIGIRGSTEPEQHDDALAPFLRNANNVSLAIIMLFKKMKGAASTFKVKAASEWSC